MKICFLLTYLLLIVLPAEAHFRHFHHMPARVPYYQRLEWVEYHTVDKDPFIDVPLPKNQDDIGYLKDRLREVNRKIESVRDKLSFPGIMSLRYRQQLERELTHLKKEKQRLQQALNTAVNVILPAPRMTVEPFITYPVYRHDLAPRYSGFRRVHP